ncbi:MAG TPA: pitrilysin family protein [Candidatus Kapabacteria bacterium]|nr:pitrilysin family protein [Candidatus Kapabacteria bacterium]
MIKKHIFFLLAVLWILVSFFPGDVLAASSGQAGTVFRLPQYEKLVLKNGLTVFLMEQHEVPLVFVSAVVPSGAIKDNDKYGLACLTAEALLFGTKSYSKSQIEEKLDFLGASYFTNVDADVAQLSASFAKKDLDTVIPILKEILADPIFDEKEFAKRKKRLLLELEQEKEFPEAVIESYFNKFLFGDHGYGNPVGGTKGTVSTITNEDLKKFYRANYKPAESAVAIVGDFNISQVKKMVRKWFGDWKATDGNSSEKVVDKPLPTFAKSRVLLVNKDDATETRFYIGSLGIRRNNPDYVAIEVINTILGGRFTSWLNDELRVNAGLTYGARSLFDAARLAGTFTLRSYTRTERTIEALDLAVQVLERLHKQGIDAATLASAQNYIKGQYPPMFERAGALANLLTDMFIYEFNETFINDFQKNVDSLTLDKAKVIIEKYFPRENLQFVLIGKASEIRDKVKKYGEVTEKEIRAEGF